MKPFVRERDDAQVAAPQDDRLQSGDVAASIRALVGEAERDARRGDAISDRKVGVEPEQLLFSLLGGPSPWAGASQPTHGVDRGGRKLDRVEIKLGDASGVSVHAPREVRRVCDFSLVVIPARQSSRLLGTWTFISRYLAAF